MYLCLTRVQERIVTLQLKVKLHNIEELLGHLFSMGVAVYLDERDVPFLEDYAAWRMEVIKYCIKICEELDYSDYLLIG